MKIIISSQESYKIVTQIWKDSCEMVLASPRASQTCGLVSDFRACLTGSNLILKTENPHPHFSNFYVKTCCNQNKKNMLIFTIFAPGWSSVTVLL